jgi:hypothetical protein
MQNRYLNLLQRLAPVTEKWHSLPQIDSDWEVFEVGKGWREADADADLDEAVVHIINSAFGYQGQKCSAASRIIGEYSPDPRLTLKRRDENFEWATFILTAGALGP